MQIAIPYRRTAMFTRASWSALTVVGLLTAAASAEDAAGYLAKIGTPRGLCVVLGDPQGELAMALSRQSELMIFWQSPREDEAAALRKTADAAGLLGTRLYFQQGDYR